MRFNSNEAALAAFLDAHLRLKQNLLSGDVHSSIQSQRPGPF